MSSRFVDALTLGPRRRRRRMLRQLAELDRVPTDQLLELDRLPPKRQRRSPHAGVRGVVTLTVWVLIVGGVAWVAGVGRQSSHRSTPTPAPGATLGQDVLGQQPPQTVSGGDSSAPPVGVDERRSRLLPVPVAPAGSGGYAFLGTSGGRPISYDPCRPIHYVIRDKATPTGGDDAVRTAIAAVSKATGLAFIADGTTTETPVLPRTLYQPGKYGKRWAPLLIAWTDPTEVPQLAGNIFGVGQSEGRIASNATRPAYVTGIVYLDAPELTSLTAQPHSFTLASVIEHELGHVVGLDHVRDPDQLMYPRTEGEHGYGSGDLRGLALEGSGSCHPEL